MKNITKILISLMVFTILVLPVVSFAQGQNTPNKGLVPCGTTTNPEPCEFKHVMILVNTIIQFTLFVLVLPISAIMFAYSGFLFLTSGGESSQRTKAKKVFSSVAIGVIIAVAAWLIVKLLLSLLGFDGAWIGF